VNHEDRDRVLAELRAEEVAAHLQMEMRWRGRWAHGPRCAEADHNSDAFALSREGFWRCHSCDKGGDLLKLLALGHKLDIQADFPAVLAIAAGIANVQLDPEGDLFGGGPARPKPVARPARPSLPPIGKRIEHAQRRAAWVWARLDARGRLPEVYLRSRGLDPARVMAREEIRATPIRMDRPGKGASEDYETLWWTMGPRRGTLAIAVPVRWVEGPALVDIRARRVEPEPGQPKIIGMVGNVTSAPAERGNTRHLIGCYGRPHLVDADHVVVCEGLFDYLTSLQVWTDAQVLGAPEAGTLELVAAYAARQLAARDGTSRLTIVEQADPPRVNKATGKMMAGAADAAMNESANAATKVALRHLHPTRVGWLYCGHPGMVDGKPIKDLNDLVRARIDPLQLHRWWIDVGDRQADEPKGCCTRAAWGDGDHDLDCPERPRA
jgi:hypothetical protein